MEIFPKIPNKKDVYRICRKLQTALSHTKEKKKVLVNDFFNEYEEEISEIDYTWIYIALSLDRDDASDPLGINNLS